MANRPFQPQLESRQQWQIDQGAKCPCRGHDEMCPCQNVEKTYRGWSISYIYPPIPVRDFDWTATHPDYDGDEDGRGVFAPTRERLLVEIDTWIEDNSDG